MIISGYLIAEVFILNQVAVLAEGSAISDTDCCANADQTVFRDVNGASD